MRIAASLVVLLLSAGSGSRAAAQCPGFSDTFASGGVDGAINAFATFDDGNGPALYAGGAFRSIGTAAAEHIARYSDGRWHALGEGLTGWDGVVNALAVFDDGGGPALYAGGSFTTAGGAPAASVAKWDGQTWSPLGAGLTGFEIGLGHPQVNALAVFDDGSGPALYAGGTFRNAGGAPANLIAKWDGASWSPLGVGIDDTYSYGGFAQVRALAVFGSELYVGGSFWRAGGATDYHIAHWNGTSWSQPGGGIGAFNSQSDYGVYTLESFDEGAGVRLFAGGLFTNSGGTGGYPYMTTLYTARFDGSAWSALPSGPSGRVLRMQSLPGANGAEPGLWCAGVFSLGGGLVRWNGSSWATAGGGVLPQQMPFGTASVRCITTWDYDQSGSASLLAGGWFNTISGTYAPNFARYTGGTTWSNASDGQGVDGLVYALAEYDDGNGPAVYASGHFEHAGGVLANSIARWDGAHWTALGAGLTANTDLSHVRALAVLDEPGGPVLVAVGDFTHSGPTPLPGGARWNGTSWTAMPSGGTVLELFDTGSGPVLYGANLGGPLPNVGYWNGSAWVSVGDANGLIYDMAVYDAGQGPELYIAGAFSNLNTLPLARHVARWNGSSWSTCGNIDGLVRALTVFDGGSGARLYAGGDFGVADGSAVNRIASFDGTAWSDVAGGVSATSNALVSGLGVFTFEPARGPELVVTGAFTDAGAVPADNIARFDGSSWSALPGGLGLGTTSDCAMLVHDNGDGRGPALYLGGDFTQAGGTAAQHVAVWQACSDPGTPFCFGDGTGTPCPCGNGGAAGHGCAHSASADGGLLAASGVASVTSDALVLLGSSMPATTSALYFQGTTPVDGGLGAVFGDGLRCIGGALIRLGTRVNVDGASSIGAPVGTTPISVKGAIPPAGATRHYGCRYRNSAAFCTSENFNYTNAVTISWVP